MEELLQALISMREERPIPDRGICQNVEELTGRTHLTTLDKLFMKWPKFSGSISFPVPHNNGHAWAFYTLPMWEGEYGASRLELLEFCIQELENRNAHLNERL